MSPTTPRCAVVLKTYAWDGFVERQARRLAEAAGALVWPDTALMRHSSNELGG